MTLRLTSKCWTYFTTHCLILVQLQEIRVSLSEYGYAAVYLNILIGNGTSEMITHAYHFSYSDISTWLASVTKLHTHITSDWVHTHLCASETFCIPPTILNYRPLSHYNYTEKHIQIVKRCKRYCSMLQVVAFKKFLSMILMQRNLRVVARYLL